MSGYCDDSELVNLTALIGQAGANAACQSIANAHLLGAQGTALAYTFQQAGYEHEVDGKHASQF